MQKHAHALRDHFEHEGAQYRTEQRAQTSDEGRKHNQDRLRDVENLFREKIVVIERIDHAGECRHAGRYHDSNHFVAERIDADRARRLFVLPNGQPKISDTALKHRSTSNKRKRGGTEKHVVKHDWVSAQIPQVVMSVLCDRQEKTRCRPGPCQVLETDAGEFGDSNREDGKINTGNAKPEREKPDKCPGGGRYRYSYEQSEPGPYAKMHKERRRCVGTKAHIKRMPQRELSGKAHHDVPGLPNIGKIEK